jgi:hypothetical protein
MKDVVRLAATAMIVVLLGAATASAVDPPEDLGFAVLCMYTAFDAEDGPAGGETFYPQYLPLTPYDTYTVMYHVQGEAGLLAALYYSVHYRQGDVDLQYGVHYGYAYDAYAPWVPDDIVGVVLDSDNVLVSFWPPLPHDGGPLLVRHAQVMFYCLPAPGAAIEVYFQPAEFLGFPPELGYLDAYGDGVAWPMYPASAGHDTANPVFQFRADPVPARSLRLTAVKDLFR